MATAMANLQVPPLITLLGAAIALACTLVTQSAGNRVPYTSAPSSTPEAPTLPPAATQPAPGLTATPGLLLHGSVHKADGTALEGVIICRSLASYSGAPVAITDGGGDFAAQFIVIPGDEMITVWPYVEGYSFDPPLVYWRHYHGFEASTLTFVASVALPDATPATPCQ
jgi:hypothetical protein